MLRRLAMLLLVSCGQAATPSQRQLAKRQLAKRQLIVKQLAMTWGGTQGAMSGDDLATGQGVMRRDDPVLCRADPISCSATPVELDCRRSTASAGGAPSACLQDVYSAIMHYVAGPSLPSGAQPTLRDRDMAPLSKLLADGHSPDVRMVINGQMFVTPLMLASVLGEFELMLVLLEHGADVSLTDASGASALIYACGMYFRAEVAARSVKASSVASPAAMAHMVTMATERVLILVDFGAELGEEPRAGVEASWSLYRRLAAATKDELDGPNRHLMKPGAVTAARYGHTAVLRRLLERGMSPDARDDEGSTLLMIASFDSQVKIVQVWANPHPNPHPNPQL